jgi:DNA processing protein
MSTTLDQKELAHWLAFSKINSVGPIRWQRLLNYFNSLNQAWTADLTELRHSGIEEAIANKIIEQRKSITPEKEYQNFLSSGYGITTINDEQYPALLKKIYAPPPLLYYRGSMEDLGTCIAIVGTRNMTTYGQKITREISFDLAQAGITVVSGLALGVDACAHQAALDANGKTLAVLGSGVDCLSPASNANLGKRIIEKSGAVISEFALGTPPHKANFPQRNRIIAGMSKTIVITEAAKKSGALITAAFAIEENREVCAVPGPIYHPTSQGPHQLIATGAKLITSAQDIIEFLELENLEAQKIITKIYPETEIEKIIYESIKAEPAHVDKIARLAKLDISVINSTLAIMEIKGIIKQTTNNHYIAC